MGFIEAIKSGYNRYFDFQGDHHGQNFGIGNYILL